MTEPTTVKKSVLVLLLIALAFSSLGPLTASAQTSGPQAQGIGSIFASSAGCVAGQILGGFVAGLFQRGLNMLKGLIPDSIKKWFAGTPEVPIHNQKQWTKEHVMDLIARCGARAILNDMTGRIIGTARTSGRDGGPSFVRDWKRFMAQGEYRGENIFRSMLMSATLCPHFSNQLKSVYKAVYQPDIDQTYTRFGNLDPYKSRASCTMPQGWNLQRYIDDFAGNGSWNSLVQLAQPQNNFFGSMLMAQAEMNTQRNQGKTEDIIEAVTGAGMISRRGENESTRAGKQGTCSNSPTTTCTVDSQCTVTGPMQSYCSETPWVTNCVDDSICFAENGTSTNSCITDSNAGRCIIRRDTCLVRGLNEQCLVYNEILTPGSVLGNSVGAVINSELTWLTSVDEMEELMSNLTTLLVSRILNLSKPDVRPQEGFPREAYPSFRGDPGFNIPNAPATGGACIVDTYCDAAAGENINTCPADCSSGGGSGVCADTGTTTARYQGQLQTAINTVSAANPGGILQQPNTFTNVVTFSNLIIAQLQASGLQGSINVLNGNGNPQGSDPDLIGVWSSGDTLFDRYDIYSNINDGSSIQTSLSGIFFTGQIPISSCSGPVVTPANVVTLCADAGGGPPCESFSFDDPDLSTIGQIIGDNTASSLQLVPGTNVSLCVDPNYSLCTNFDLNVPDLTTVGLNDVISSIRINISPPTTGGGGGGNDVSICSDINGGGTCANLGIGQSIADTTDPQLGFSFGNGASSFTINTAATVILCVTTNFTGGCHSFTASESDLTNVQAYPFPYPGLNDIIYSVRITP